MYYSFFGSETSKKVVLADRNRVKIPISVTDARHEF